MLNVFYLAFASGTASGHRGPVATVGASTEGENGKHCECESSVFHFYFLFR